MFTFPFVEFKKLFLFPAIISRGVQKDCLVANIWKTVRNLGNEILQDFKTYSFINSNKITMMEFPTKKKLLELGH